MFKQELPLMFPEDEDVQRVARHIFDPFEYLSIRNRAGHFDTEFKGKIGKVAYQVACHQRVQNIGPRTRDILNLIPDTDIKMIERCSGHDGTYAVKSETYAAAQKIARPVARQIEQHEAEHVTSDCPMAGSHVAHAAGHAQASHPISLLRQAYGI
jgi:Fe-S oxidoreductase